MTKSNNRLLIFLPRNDRYITCALLCVSKKLNCHFPSQAIEKSFFLVNCTERFICDIEVKRNLSTHPADIFKVLVANKKRYFLSEVLLSLSQVGSPNRQGTAAQSANMTCQFHLFP